MRGGSGTTPLGEPHVGLAGETTFGSSSNDASSPRLLAVWLHTIPGVHRLTPTANGSYVVTCHVHGGYETWELRGDGTESQPQRRMDWRGALLLHDEFVEQAGGRCGAFPA